MTLPTGRASPRLIATDLDGTLLRSDGSVSERTAGALAALEAEGVPVVFVTGRPLRWMDVVREHVGAQGLAICSNGAVVVELRAGRIDLARAIPADTALDVVHDLRLALPGVRFAAETAEGFAMEPGYPVRHAVPAGTRVEVAERLVGDGDAVKLMARQDGADPDALLAAVASVVGDRVEATTSEAVPMVEMSAAGVTKATTLALLCERIGVTAGEVVAFGDMPNDLPMLRWAGRSFAVGNSHPALARVVTDRTGSADEDGVALALEAMFGLEPPVSR